MAFQYKTLLRLAPAALLIVAFQNCAPQKFAQTSAASEKSFATDGTGPVSVDPSIPSVINDPADSTSDDSNHGYSDEVLTPRPHPDSGNKSPEAQRASNCKDLRAKFIAMKIKPAVMPKIESKGASVAGPFYVSKVDLIEAKGASDVYVVGADSNAMAMEIRAVGAGHVVLCGVHAGKTETKGASVVDVIGANVVGEVKSVGASNVNILDEDGKPL